jgi:hypothetical protein
MCALVTTALLVGFTDCMYNRELARPRTTIERIRVITVPAGVP